MTTCTSTPRICLFAVDQNTRPVSRFHTAFLHTPSIRCLLQIHLLWLRLPGLLLRGSSLLLRRVRLGRLLRRVSRLRVAGICIPRWRRLLRVSSHRLLLRILIVRLTLPDYGRLLRRRTTRGVACRGGDACDPPLRLRSGPQAPLLPVSNDKEQDEEHKHGEGVE